MGSILGWGNWLLFICLQTNMFESSYTPGSIASILGTNKSPAAANQKPKEDQALVELFKERPAPPPPKQVIVTYKSWKMMHNAYQSVFKWATLYDIYFIIKKIDIFYIF